MAEVAAAAQARVCQAQRARLLEAMAMVVGERGLRGASMTSVAEHAGVSRTTATEQFESLDGCFLALLDSMLVRGVKLASEAFEREPCWTEGVLAGLEALLLFLDEDPVRTRVCLLERAAVPPSELGQRALKLGELSQLLHARLCRELPSDSRPSETMAEATVLSVLGLLRIRLLSGEAPPFAALLGQLSGVVISPYLPPEAAAKVESRGRLRAHELLKQPPVGGARVEVPSLLRHARAHRLRSCIRYLAENPHVSNQEIGSGLAISHAGQVSALLSRLREAGLIEKKSSGAGRPNAWKLSPRGAEIAQLLERW